MGALKEFLQAERSSTDDMSIEELQSEVQGFRAMVEVMPPEILEWMCRIGEPFRVVTRKYEAKTGVLTHVSMEPKDFTLLLVETGFDMLRGTRTIEEKRLTIGPEIVAYYEDVYDIGDYEDWQAEQALASQTLE